MDFNYKIKEDDESIKDVELDEKFYNYSKSNLHVFDESYEELYQDILYDDSIVYDYIYPKKNFDKKYVIESINIWKNLGITLHNLNIFKRFVDVDNLFEVNNKLFRSFNCKDASSLTLQFEKMPQWDSKVRMLEIDDDKYKGIVFKSIVLPKLDKYLTSTIYAHEMSHAQLLTKDGGTNSIFNEETIPILMEYIFANSVDNSTRTLRYVQNERLMSVCKFLFVLGKSNEINYERRVTSEKYIISSLQAIKLFEIYYKGNDNVKKELLSYIKNIFEGNIIVEDMLNKFDANFEQVSNKKKELKLF